MTHHYYVVGKGLEGTLGRGLFHVEQPRHGGHGHEGWVEGPRPRPPPCGACSKQQGVYDALVGTIGGPYGPWSQEQRGTHATRGAGGEPSWRHAPATKVLGLGASRMPGPPLCLALLGLAGSEGGVNTRLAW